MNDIYNRYWLTCGDDVILNHFDCFYNFWQIHPYVFMMFSRIPVSIQWSDTFQKHVIFHEIGAYKVYYG